MDPNEARKRLVELAERAIDGDPGTLPGYHDVMNLATELAETFLGLDEWLQKDGYLPHAWHTKEPGRGPS